MKKTTKRLEIKTTTVRALVDEDLRGVAGGVSREYKCTDGLCPSSAHGTCDALCQSVFGSRCTSC